MRLPVKVDKGKGDIIVLLHGLGTNYKSWQYVLDNIDYTKNRIIALDLLGFGSAPKPDREYTLDDHVSAVLDTLSDLRIRKASLAGHSMGCNVAIGVAYARPDLVDRTVLLGAPLYKKPPRLGFRWRFWKAERAYGIIFKTLLKNPEVTIAAAKSLKVLAPLVKGMQITEETWKAFRLSLHNTLVSKQSYQEALGLKVPALYIYGKLDIFVLKRTIRRVSRKNKYASMKVVIGPHEITPLQGSSLADVIQAWHRH